MRGQVAVLRVVDGATVVVVGWVEATEVVAMAGESCPDDDPGTSPDEQATARTETERTSHHNRGIAGPVLLREGRRQKRHAGIIGIQGVTRVDQDGPPVDAVVDMLDRVGEVRLVVVIKAVDGQ